MATMVEVVEALDGPLKHLFELLRDHLLELGPDTRREARKNYIAFKRLRGSAARNFACVKVRPAKRVVRVYVKRDDLPADLGLDGGLGREAVGGTGDFELTVRTPEDLEGVSHLLRSSYEAS